ncbi:MAG TPA: GspH/FimT family pseudopilin [Roseateles sp.]|nr:GspH/FimT family pseudopilin [Roseateles sp.]
MLRRPGGQRGVGLIEAIVTLVVAGLLLAMAMPSFSIWLQNSRIRQTAESILAGLQFAKSEATTRNALVRFQLTSSVGDDCAISGNGSSWVVDVVDAADDSVEGRCNATPSDSEAPGILMVRSATEGSGDTRVQATTAALVFNGLSRLSPAPNGNITINVGNADGQRCAANGGDLSCLRIVVTTAGQVRMCNPRFAAGDPQAC